MQITIDTSKDSRSEIIKAIEFLKKLVEEQSEDSTLESTPGFVNIFGDEPATTQESEKSEEHEISQEPDATDVSLEMY